MLYVHNDINNNRNTNTGGLSFQIRMGLLISGFILVMGSCMSGLSNLDSFHDVAGGHTAAAFLGTASKICSILLAAFLCNCRQAFSPYI